MPSQDFESLLRSIQKAAVPINSLEEDSVRDLMMTADVIWGYDAGQDVMALFYGRDVLEEIAAGREAGSHQMLLCFSLELDSGDPDVLCAAVRELRGPCVYRRASAE